MNIGFDFDKVFIDYPPGLPDVLFDKLYKKKSNGTLLYRIPSKPEQVFRRLTHLSFLRPLIKENVAFLRSIPKQEHRIYLVSSRFGFLEQVTSRLVKKHGFDKIFDGMYFNFQNLQPHLFKSEVIKELKLDMYVDDDLPLLRYVARHNKRTRFYWLNKSVAKQVTHNITGVTTLSDVLTLQTRVTAPK